MTLPNDFVFSQTSLQDFTDCRRRFQLRYLDKIDWPAVEAEPVHEQEHRMRQGAIFHRMAYQLSSGIEPAKLSTMTLDEALHRWWNNFLEASPYELPGQHYPELFLSAPLSRWMVVAKIDLLVLSPEGQATILDWKTSQKKPPRSWVEKRLQTRIYRYIVTKSATKLNQGEAISPEGVEMIYWYPDFPNEPERLQYSQEQYERDQIELVDLVEKMDQLELDAFHKTDDLRYCRFCSYRSLCDRGETAGQLDELQDDFDDKDDHAELDFNFEQIAEIEF